MRDTTCAAKVIVMKNDDNNYANFCYCIWSKVFLGRKKDENTDVNSPKLYAIKMMKKTELVKKNMIEQGSKIFFKMQLFSLT